MSNDGIRWVALQMAFSTTRGSTYVLQIAHTRVAHEIRTINRRSDVSEEELHIYRMAEAVAMSLRILVTGFRVSLVIRPLFTRFLLG